MTVTQIPYESRVSGEIEYLPFCASILGFKDSEKMLVKLVKEAFEAANWPVRLKTGRMAFPDDIHPRSFKEQSGGEFEGPLWDEL